MNLQPGGQPFIVCLAGPNGAGKSTFYELFLSGLPVALVNADRIASLLPAARPRGDYEAAKLAEMERRRLVSEGASFVMETVFSDPKRAKAGFLVGAERKGYFVALVYIGLSSAGLCAARVAHRVRNGGHAVPANRIAKRYGRSLDNLARVIDRLAMARLYDNSGGGFELVAECVRGWRLYKAPTIPAWAAPAASRMAIGRRNPGGQPAIVSLLARSAPGRGRPSGA